MKQAESADADRLLDRTSRLLSAGDSPAQTARLYRVRRALDVVTAS
jgi:hypothetical protein